MKTRKLVNTALSFILFFLIIGAYLQTSPELELPLTVSPDTATPAVSGVSTSSPNTSNTRIYFTDQGSTNTGRPLDQELVRYIDSANVSIDAAFFELDLQSVTDALIRAKQRGVEVRLVYDDEHTNADPQIRDLQKSDVPSTPDERSAFMHNKFLVVDGECIWTGSFNWTSNANNKNSENAIYVCDQQLAQNYQVEFEEMFAGQFGPTSPSNTPYRNINIGRVDYENYFAPEDDPIDRIIEIVGSAKQSVHFMAFSFTHDSLGQVMLNKQESGLDIAGIFETRGADTQYSQCGPLLRSGASIKLDNNSATFHHKVIVVDSSIVIVGSFNFSDNASNSNDENLLIIHDPSIAQIYENEFARLYSQSITPSGNSCNK